jgi:hypothetical protein
VAKIYLQLPQSCLALVPGRRWKAEKSGQELRVFVLSGAFGPQITRIQIFIKNFSIRWWF